MKGWQEKGPMGNCDGARQRLKRKIMPVALSGARKQCGRKGVVRRTNSSWCDGGAMIDMWQVGPMQTVCVAEIRALQSASFSKPMF